MKAVVINRVREEWGELGNMAPFPVEYEGVTYPTSEHLFQRLRLTDDALRHEVVQVKNPMSAKMRAKKLMKENPDKTLPVCCDEDMVRMKMVLELKLQQHEKIKDTLLLTGDRFIVEDATRRQRGSGLFWGAALQEDGSWKGDNALGKLWMIIRDEFFGE